MPYRVPEGPVDPYEPFPFRGPDAGAWAPAPIVRGRDLGRPAAAVAQQVPDEAGEARFIDIDDDAALRIPADSLLTFDEPLEVPAHAGDGAPHVSSGRNGDDTGWELVSPEEAPTLPAIDDPWAVVEGADAVVEGAEALFEVDEGTASTGPSVDLGQGQPFVHPSPFSYPTRQPGGPPLSSRAILIIGGLALLCLMLAAALAFQALGNDDMAPALDAPAAGAGLASAAPASSSIRDAANWTESLPVSDTTLTAIERAALGPLEGELQRLARALGAAFGRSSADVAPVLRPYIAHAAQRMSVHPARFRLVVEAPDVELASARADAILRALQGAGLPADKVAMTATAGAPSVRFDR